VYPTTIVGIPPMEDFYIGGASSEIFLPIFKMNFPEIVTSRCRRKACFHNLVFVSIKKTLPDAGLQDHARPLGHGPDDVHEIHRGGGRPAWTSTTRAKCCSISRPTPIPQRDSIFTKGPSDVLDHATSEIAMGSKLGIDATKKIPGEGFSERGRR